MIAAKKIRCHIRRPIYRTVCSLHQIDDRQCRCKRRIFDQRYRLVYYRRQDRLHSLRHYDVRHGLPPGNPQCESCFILSPVDTVDAAPVDFCKVCSIVEHVRSARTVKNTFISNIQHQREEEIKEKQLQQQRSSSENPYINFAEPCSEVLCGCYCPARSEAPVAATISSVSTNSSTVTTVHSSIKGRNSIILSMILSFHLS